MRHLRTCWALIALVACIAQCPAASAQNLPGRKELKRADLSGAPGMEVVTSIVEFKPGRTVPTGANLQNLRDAVHVVDKGKPLFEPAAKPIRAVS